MSDEREIDPEGPENESGLHDPPFGSKKWRLRMEFSESELKQIRADFKKQWDESQAFWREFSARRPF